MKSSLQIENKKTTSEVVEDIATFKTVETFEKSYGESFYLFDIEKLRTNYEKMSSAFLNRYSKTIIGYSYKTNYLPALIEETSRLGAYAEVVSRVEYDLAIKIGVPPSKIIYNGPLKTYDDIAIAFEGGSILNLDSFYEIELVKNYARTNNRFTYKVGLRAGFNLASETYDSELLGYDQSRFGFCVENGSLERAINELARIMNVKVVGFHGHFSTKTRSLEVYREITQKLCNLSKRYLANSLEYIDIGGGMFGNVPKELKVQNAPTFEAYADVICSIIDKEKHHFLNDPYLIIEPGLALVVDTFKFFCKVIDIKQKNDVNFVLVNGSIHNIKPTMHSTNLPMDHIKKHDSRYETGQFNVVGVTCMEKDYLVNNYQADIPRPGDYLMFRNVGAYTIVFDPPFIKERPPIIVKEKNNYKIVRKREKLKDFINEDVYVFS